MKKLLIFILMLHCINASCQSTSKNQKTILIIAAHPDDEIAIGGEVAVKYRRLGHKVFTIIATDGKDGTRVTNIPAGDSLGQIRRQESNCAAKKLGTEPPIFLGG